MKRNNPGKRERMAGKRHFRGSVVMSPLLPPDSEPLKMGSKHYGRWMRYCQSVADVGSRN